MMAIVMAAMCASAFGWELQFSREMYCQSPFATIPLWTAEPCNRFPGSFCTTIPQRATECPKQKYYSIDVASKKLNFFTDKHCTTPTKFSIVGNKCTTWNIGMVDKFEFSSMIFQVNASRVDTTP